MTPRIFLSGIVVLFAAAAQASAGHVQTELLANVSAIQPGKPFWLGVRLTMDPGWHVYWKNPGDSGIPTRVKLTLPDGFTAGSLQFPTPSRFVQPGNIVIFGYENSVMLLTEVTPPAHLSSDFLGQFHAAVDWLVCSDVCIPGKATVSLTLGATKEPSPGNQELFNDWAAQLPTELIGGPRISVDASTSGKVIVSIIWNHAAPDQVEFLPETPDDYNIADTQVKSSQNTTTISFTARPLAGKPAVSTTLEAVLGYFNSDGKRRGLIFSVALPVPAANNH
jgi:thiol:disulfide interchange protein DsbD